MEVSKSIELARIGELKILHNVRLVHRHDLNHIYSKENLRVQFTVSGEMLGGITCYLCLDGHELNPAEKNYLFPLFLEAMNILIGGQISHDEEINGLKIKLSAPKLIMNPVEINTALKSQTQKYYLELDSVSFCVLTEYVLELVN
jgi:hypothetical protein